MSTVDPKLLQMLVCPATKTQLTYDLDHNELISQVAGLAYPIRNGIPIMLTEEARIVDPAKAKLICPHLFNNESL